MSARIDRVAEELEKWGKGVLLRSPPASHEDITALEAGVRQTLPDDYRALLRLCNGADLRGDRLMSAEESLDAWQSLRTLMTHIYREDPDWGRPEPPHHLLPVAVDLEGNLKCLDFSAGAEIVDWHRETCTFTTWHSGVSQWLMTCLSQLAIRFDHRGRPRPIRGREGDLLQQRELEAWLATDPDATFPRLEMAIWMVDYRPPEEALFAYRRATEGSPPMALAHYEHARFAIAFGRLEEARKQLRRCLAVPIDPANPRKHDFRDARRPAAHSLLSTMYGQIGQQKKADAERKAAEKAASRYGFLTWDESAEYQEALAAIRRRGG